MHHAWQIIHVLLADHDLGPLQLRDLRLLDPQLATSYPSAILARDRALVLNLEFIKAVVTIDCVLILNPGGSQARCSSLYPNSLGAVMRNGIELL